MSYTNDLDKPTDYFNTVTWTGNGSARSITGVGFAPDLVWSKARQPTSRGLFHDTIRGATKYVDSTRTIAEYTEAQGLTAFGSDGFNVGTTGEVNYNGDTFVAWNWLAGGTAPAITYSVKVVSDSGNKYRFDDFGTSAVTLDLQEGGTYTFDQSDSSNSGHPLRFSTTSNGTHGGGSEYTTGVTTTGTPGNAGAKTVITVGSGVATLYYYCTQHSAMGGQANTNSTSGSSNFGGSIQANVSANTTSGFSIVSYSGSTNSTFTVGHGLGAVPKIFILKKTSSSGTNWVMYNANLGNDKRIQLNNTDASASTSGYGNTDPTSSVFTVSNGSTTGADGQTYIAYCFAEKKGYSKFGTYTGGTLPFIYLGFKPAMFLVKEASATNGYHWVLFDNKRDTDNPIQHRLQLSSTVSEYTDLSDVCDFVSNGLKFTYQANNWANTDGRTYIFMAFAENPFVTSTGIPTTAR